MVLELASPQNSSRTIAFARGAVGEQLNISLNPANFGEINAARLSSCAGGTLFEFRKKVVR
jgi:hypothetical protein